MALERNSMILVRSHAKTLLTKPPFWCVLRRSTRVYSCRRALRDTNRTRQARVRPAASVNTLEQSLAQSIGNAVDPKRINLFH
jgi:hypothetical protein